MPPYKIGEKTNQIFNIEVKEVDKENFTLEAIFSTKREDRHGDVVLQEWDLKNFKKNPVILNSHNYNDATEVIGKASKVKVVDGKLQGTIKFAVNENPKAKIVFDLYAGGYLNAFSVGFIPLEFDKDYTILKSELLEVSAVSVPANAEALAKAMDDGIDVKQIENYVEKNIEDEKDNGEDAEGDDNDNKGGGEEGDEKNKELGLTKEFEEWENGDNEVRLKLREIDAFVSGTFEKIVYVGISPKINGIIAMPKGGDRKQLQSLQFPKDEGWTMDDAKKYYSSNQAEITNWQKALQKIEVKKIVSTKSVVSDFVKSEAGKEKKVLVRAKEILSDVLGDNVDKTKVNKNDVYKAVRGLLKNQGIK